MRISGVKDLGPGGDAGASVSPQLGGDDFLSRVNATITNLKELIKMYRDLRGAPSSAEPGSNEPANPQSGLNKTNLVKFLSLLIDRGYGSMTVGDILKQAEPLTIKQIMELMKRV